MTTVVKLQHDTNSINCWCEPEFFVPCIECEEDKGCWKCEKGLIRISYWDAVHCDEPLVIVHHLNP